MVTRPEWEGFRPTELIEIFADIAKAAAYEAVNVDHPGDIAGRMASAVEDAALVLEVLSDRGLLVPPDRRAV